MYRTDGGRRFLRRAMLSVFGGLALYSVAVVIGFGGSVAGPAPAHAVLPPGGTGFSCETSMTFYGLGNPYHPNYIGFQSTIACNTSTISSASCLRFWFDGYEWLLLGGSCSTPGSNTGLLITTNWYSCQRLATLPIYTYDGVGTWHVTKPDGKAYLPGGSNPQDFTATHSSRCDVNPVPVIVVANH